MNSRTTPRGTFPAGATQQSYHPAPNAALLIDFDNVTMAIRSDLGKELKMLLNSEVIRGKVAVQRAYADWRRYPQYIVPLAESSVDLIFAPAYGSSKKNATDLRMAIDAMELVFTRPEIGTFILMTGDSDFSSCVLKLKEYGKYVIGVGMRESSSDLLIQNCDEYYSYHSLSGLTREGDVEDSKEDPWVLVKRAVQQMIKNGDVMRTDRLKQVMLDLDPGFDEKKIGYSKFSRFVSEASSKGLIRLRKMENGQYEILDSEAEEKERKVEKPADSREKVVERIVAEAEAETSGNGRRRRGRGGRDERGRQDAQPAEKPSPIPEEAPAEVPAAAKPDGGPAGTEEAKPEVAGDLETAYALLQEAVRQLGGSNGKGVRDGDVKRRMLDISADFDEGQFGFSKFTRFLRQAHDAEVIDLTRAGAGNYEVSLPASGRKLPPPTAPKVEPTKAADSRKTEQAEERKPVEAGKEAPEGDAEQPQQPAARAVVPGALRGRRGGRSGGDGPPPILPGQAIRSPLQSEEVAATGKAAEAAEAAAETPAAAAVESAPEQETVEETKAGRGRSRGRRGRGKRTKEAEAETAAVAPAAESKAAEEGKPSVSRSRRGRRTASAKADEGPPAILEGQTATLPESTKPEGEGQKKTTRSRKPRSKKESEKKPAGFSAAALGLPSAEADIRTHLAGYKGIGKKTVDSLLETFGTGVYEGLQERPQEVRDLLGDRRAKTLLEQWGADYQGRAGEESKAAQEQDRKSAEKKPSGSRRGSRGRGGKKRDTTKSS